MADYELHADYDRNGRLDATAAEYGRRAAAPGAILVPNLDADGRALPANVAPGPRIVLDGHQPIAPATDDEQLPVRILVRKASAAIGTRFFLRPVGFPRIRLRFNDAQGRMLPRDLARGDDLPIAVPSAPGQLDLRLSTQTLPGSPIGHVTDLNGRFSADGEDEANFGVQLISVDAAGRESKLDEARFSVAPFVILDHSATAVRTYIVEGANAPSLIEMEGAHKAIGVPLVRVPYELSRDTWLQDQFQHALIQGPDRWRQVIVHLPRLRSDTYSGTSAVNLARFVTSHFPSRNLGLFDDLWARDLQVFDIRQKQHRIAFGACERLAAEMERGPRLFKLLVERIQDFEPSAGIDPWENWTEVMTRVPGLLERLSRLASKAAGTANREQRESLEALKADARERWTALLGRTPYNPRTATAGLPIGTGQIEVDAVTANRVHARVAQMRSSANYGGNIEASPPTEDAPLGKIVIGNMVIGSGDEARDFMDPDVLRVLFRQAKQPIVAIDTTWLHVGHVDEVMTFVPDRSGAAGFALLQASPGLAMALLRGARDRFFAGLSAADRSRFHDEPSGVAMTRLTDLGASPVTRLNRGKLWRHVHETPTGDAVPSIAEPPLIYQRLAWVMNGNAFSGINLYGQRYWPGPGPIRHYPADITVLELLFAEQDGQRASTNDHIATAKMKRIDEPLKAAFPKPRRFPLPVVFDSVPSVATWATAPLAFKTAGFTSNVVNLQVINGHLLIPRPYGPRMKPDDAIAVITEAMRACGVPPSVARRIDARFIRKHTLTTGVYWLEPQKRIARPIGYGTYSGTAVTTPIFDGLENLTHVIEQFRDSFPGADDAQLRKSIYDPNRKSFDQNEELLPGWHRIEIADGMVDLFEASVLAVAEELGVPVHWIDSWFYHVRTGEIHCGTNVLRVPARDRALPNVWDVKTLRYGPQEFNFEELDVTTPRSP